MQYAVVCSIIVICNICRICAYKAFDCENCADTRLLALCIMIDPLFSLRFSSAEQLEYRNFELDFIQQICYIYIVQNIFVDAHTKVLDYILSQCRVCRSIGTALLRVPLCPQEGVFFCPNGCTVFC